MTQANGSGRKIASMNVRQMHENGVTAMTNTELQEWFDKQQENQDAINATAAKLRHELDAAFETMRANLKVRNALSAFGLGERCGSALARGKMPFITN